MAYAEVGVIQEFVDLSLAVVSYYKVDIVYIVIHLIYIYIITC